MDKGIGVILHFHSKYGAVLLDEGIFCGCSLLVFIIARSTRRKMYMQIGRCEHEEKEDNCIASTYSFFCRPSPPPRSPYPHPCREM